MRQNHKWNDNEEQIEKVNNSLKEEDFTYT